MGPVAEARRDPVGAAFIAGLTLAQVGAYMSFIPLLQILVPLKAAEIDPAHKAITLAQVSLMGAVVAGLANLVAGAVSDRTTSRFGRRRPWLLIGAAGTLGGYFAIRMASNLAGLMSGLIFFQIAFNFLFAALLALVVDRVPGRQRGLVSALLGLGLPLGSVGGAVLIGGVISGETLRFLVLGAIVVLTVAPFAVVLRDRPIDAEHRPRGRLSMLSATFWVDPRRHPDFACAWAGRFLVLIGVSLIQSYMLYYLAEGIGYARLYPGARPEQGLAVLTAIAAAFQVAFALAGGLLSDRLRRRKPFVMAGALILSGAMAGVALFPTFAALTIAYAVFGLGAGVYFAVDIALVTEVLPSAADAGKDLGIINLSNTTPQVLAPMIAVMVLGVGHADFRTLFLLAAACSAAGAVMVLPIRAVR